MELKDLVGEHVLSGFDTAIAKHPERWMEQYAVVRFLLDGKTYKAVEDPSDGYRSYLEDLVITDEKVSNTFPPHKVTARMAANGESSTNDIIELWDDVTHKVVLSVGTSNIDDYYPCCVIKWNPENLAINVGK